MRKAILTFAMLLSISCAAYAQTLSEIFEGNNSMESIFVNPLGITNAVEDTDIESLKSKASLLGLTYNVLPLGPFGEAMSVEPSDFQIEGVDVSRVIILVNKDINMLFLTTAPSDEFRKACAYLEENLSPYKKNKETSKSEISNFKLYMLTDRYGIAVGDNPNSKTVTAIVMDMRNLKNFIEMGSLFPH